MTSTCKDCTTCSAGGEDSGLPCDGVRLNLYTSDSDFCDCCPTTCISYREEGQSCYKEKTGGNIDGMCGPRLTCGPDSTCVPITDTCCMKSLREYNEALASGSLGMDMMEPQCDDEGYWAPVQCTGSDVCRCVDKESGFPIHGLETNMTAVPGMDCACSRDAEVIRKLGCGMELEYGGPSQNSEQRFSEAYSRCMSGGSSYFSPGHLRCLPNGNYDPAQCIEQTTDAPANPAYTLEDCFCYYPGVKFNSSIAPINVAHVLLECHQLDELHVQGFYRPCELKHVLKRKHEEYYKAEGRSLISNEWLETCSIDGFFAKVQRKPDNIDQGFCVDRNGTPLEGYEGTYSQMDCECATVRNMTSEWGEKPVCDSQGSGSYRKSQCKAGMCYCVDRFGRQCGKEVNEFDFDDSSCAAYEDPVTGEAAGDKAPTVCETFSSICDQS